MGEGMRFTFWMPARRGERFALGSFDSQVGKSIRLIGHPEGSSGIIRGAVVAPDGSGVELDIEPTSPSR